MTRARNHCNLRRGYPPTTSQLTGFAKISQVPLVVAVGSGPLDPVYSYDADAAAEGRSTTGEARGINPGKLQKNRLI